MTSLSRASVALLAFAALAGCGSAPPSVAVPNVVGVALDAAKATLVTAGFASYPQDLLRDRYPLLDSDWTVCRQSPGQVAAAAGSTVDLGVVKKAETCPDAAASAARPTAAAAPPTTHAAVGSHAATPKPKPQPAARTTAVTSPVRSGTFCDPPATAISDRGTAMICAPAADGRNRWKRA